MEGGNLKRGEGVPVDTIHRDYDDAKRPDLGTPVAPDGQRMSETRRPSQWSDWEWNETYERNYRYRIRSDGDYEFEYEYIPEEKNSSSLVATTQDLSLASEDIVQGNSDFVAEPRSAHRVTTGYTYTQARNDSILRPDFQVHPSIEFRFGRVFKILWTEPSGNSNNFTVTSAESRRKQREQAYTSMRRFVIINALRGHCLCLPIITYSGQGVLKPGVDASTHTVIYTSSKPETIGGEVEQGLALRPIRVFPTHPRNKLDKTSRLNYAKIYTVEYNVKVCFIGHVDSKFAAWLVADFSRINSFTLQEPTSSGVHKTLHSDYKEASRALLKRGRVFSTPYTEIAGPSAPESDDITLDPYGNRIHTKIRRAIVVRDMPSHCLCVPINTYGGRENKYLAQPQDLYYLFSVTEDWDKSRIARKELPLVLESPDVEINYALATVDFTKVFYLQHYALVKKIGRIDKLGLPLLEECLRRALGMPITIEESNPLFISMFSPTHLKWYGLITSVESNIQNNWISTRTVNRLRLSSITEDLWEHGDDDNSIWPEAATSAVTATFKVSNAQSTHECVFYVTDTATFDVCFSTTFITEHKDEYPEFFDMMHLPESNTIYESASGYGEARDESYEPDSIQPHPYDSSLYNE